MKESICGQGWKTKTIESDQNDDMSVRQNIKQKAIKTMQIWVWDKTDRGIWAVGEKWKAVDFLATSNYLRQLLSRYDNKH